MSSLGILVVVLFVCLLFSVPIGVSLGLATVVALVTSTNTPTLLVSQNAFAGLDSFPLMAVPFFMLAGSLMTYGGIARRIVKACDILVGKVTGGLGMATIAACMFFAAISGSAQATVSAIGTMMLPEMEKRGYEKTFSTGLVATAGTIGVIIPPSIPFVIYGVASGASVGNLFIAGVLPGFLIGFSLMGVCYYICKKRGYLGHLINEAKEKKKESALSILREAFWAIMAPVIVLGGIYGGVFTPTEAAVVAVVYALIIGIFIYRELTFSIILDALRATCDLCGLTALALGFSMAFANFLVMQQIPVKLTAFIEANIHYDWMVMAFILFILLCVGLFVDNISACLCLTPVLLPIAEATGMDAIQFGVVMTTALAIGFVTPPYGCNLFTASAISKLSIEKISRAALPFLFAMFLDLLVITYWSPISTVLVDLMK